MRLVDQDGPVVKFGKFELVEQIGKGGMATVHRAILRGMGGFEREVVIKRILTELTRDEHFVNMFIEEAKLSALLDHPNIVQVYDFGLIDDHYYLSMEYIQGLTLLKLRKSHRRRSPFPAEAAAYILHQVCLGLDYTHRLSRDGQPLGLVHRDVSPSNVMVSAHGEVKLLDFGIAKAVEAIDNEQTRTGTLKGKWSYMSPEQVVGAQVTFRSDIFACGIVLWELLSGRRLFKDKTDFLTLSNVANARVPPLSTYREDLHPVFDEVCQRALARNPQDRYGSAEEMADHLWTCLAERPCSNSTLSAMVGSLMQDNTVELQTDMLQEVSGSSSASASATSRPQSKESFTSLPAGEQELVEPALTRGRLLISLATGGFALATLVVVGVLCMMQPPARPPTPAAQLPAPRPVPAGQPAAPIPTPARIRPTPPTRPAPTLVQILVVSTPSRATLRLGTKAEVRGVTPLMLALPRSSKPMEVVATRPNYLLLRHRMVPDHDQKVEFVLEKARPPTSAAPQPNKDAPKKDAPNKDAAKKNASKRDVPNLRSGELADPYGD